MSKDGDSAIFNYGCSELLTTHRVRTGDTIARITQEYGCSASALKRLNRLYGTVVLEAGQELKVPLVQPIMTNARRRSHPVSDNTPATSPLMDRATLYKAIDDAKTRGRRSASFSLGGTICGADAAACADAFASSNAAAAKLKRRNSAAALGLTGPAGNNSRGSPTRAAARVAAFLSPGNKGKEEGGERRWLGGGSQNSSPSKHATLASRAWSYLLTSPSKKSLHVSGSSEGQGDDTDWRCGGARHSRSDSGSGSCFQPQLSGNKGKSVAMTGVEAEESHVGATTCEGGGCADEGELPEPSRQPPDSAEAPCLPMPRLLNGESSVVPDKLIAKLESTLLPERQGYNWLCLFSSLRHGSGYLQFYDKVQNEAPTLVLGETMSGEVFGGYAAEPWHESESYYGSGESFLFAIKGDEVTKYPWTGLNRYFQYSKKETMGMGGGGGSFGFIFGEDFATGGTGFCSTFENEPLCSESSFDVQQVEVWGFTLAQTEVAARIATLRHALKTKHMRL